MHFPSSGKVIFLFSVHLEPHIVIVSRCERGAGRDEGVCVARKERGTAGVGRTRAENGSQGRVWAGLNYY